jgi:8-oxo-dGTP pyrophosphatase MutT (NUDIX family)
MSDAKDTLDTHDAPILVAILIAARKTGDRTLEAVARRELEERHGIKLTFTKPCQIRLSAVPK